MAASEGLYRVVAMRSDGSVARRLRVRGLGFSRMIAAMWRWHHRELAVRIERSVGGSIADGFLFELKPR